MQTIQELQAQLANGSTTAEKLAQASLEKIESTKNLNAYISVLNDRALERAKESDKRRAEGKSLGALDGIPVAVKDNMCLTGTRTTAASKILDNFVAPYTATALEKLEAAGAIIVGKTNMDEFAMGSSNETSYYGPVKNPLDESRVPGGSSGGSAVAVASGTVPCALGSDTGGSIRQPAACTGVVGLKPTYGRVSRYGLLAYASSLDQIGPFGATVRDCATLLGAICGIDPHDNTTSTRPNEDFTAKLGTGVKGKVIGVPKEYFGEGLDAECKAAIENMLKKMEAEGATIKEVSLPHISYAVSSYYIIEQQKQVPTSAATTACVTATAAPKPRNSSTFTPSPAAKGSVRRCSAAFSSEATFSPPDSMTLTTCRPRRFAASLQTTSPKPSRLAT